MGSFRVGVTALAACAAIAFALWNLFAATTGLEVSRRNVGSTPVTIFRQPGQAAAPVVVIAHGFAGSQQLMLPFATTLARNGYIAVTFDFVGHGRNPEPLRGSITDVGGATKSLVGNLAEVVDFARQNFAGDGRLALVGHSMASDIVVRYALAHPEVDTTVAVSMFAEGVTATSPRDLLVIVGALEPAMLKDQAVKAAATVANDPQERVTYGSFADGTARRFAFSAGVEHIGVLYSRETMAETVQWLNGVFSRNQANALDSRGTWIGLLVLGIAVLAWPLARLLPVAATQRIGAALPWKPLLLVGLGPALLTPLILWKVPTSFLPILLGDYLAAHFAIYGLLTLAGLAIVTRGTPKVSGPVVSIANLSAAAALVGLYSIFAFALPLDRFVISFMPIPVRLPLIGAMLIGTLPYFLADEWLTRGAVMRRGAYAFTKVCFVLSLGIAVALNLERLFFLIIIVPVIILFFVVYGLFSSWAYRRTQHPAVGGLANALAFAWAIAVTFPMLGP